MPNDGRVQLVDAALLREVGDRAAAAPRLRMNHNFHRTLDENPNRLLNVLTPGSYIAPHRHLDPPKPESFLVLDGLIEFFIFDDDGNVTGRHTLGPLCEAGATAVGIDLAPGIWHTLVATTPRAVCYEVKPGPYSPIDDKAFAPWAPREGEAGAKEYMERLLEG